MAELKTKLVLRNDSAVNWTTNNPKLLKGEIGIELDTRLLKIGDGIHTWNELTYFKGDLSSISGDLTEFKEQIEAAIARIDLKDQNQDAAFKLFKEQYATTLEELNTKNNTQDAALEALKAKHTEEVAALQSKDTAQDERMEKIEGIDTAQNKRLDAVEAKNSEQDNTLATHTEDLKSIHGRLDNVTNVMDFRGALTALPSTTEGYEKGDVIVITEGEDAGKEFVCNGSVWVEFGNSNAEQAAISALDTRVSTHDTLLAGLRADVNTKQTASQVNDLIQAATIKGSKVSGAVGSANKVVNTLTINLPGKDAVTFDGSSTQTVDLPSAKADTLGLVKGNATENGVNVDNGSMTVHSLNVNKLVQTTGDVLIFNGGNSKFE